MLQSFPFALLQSTAAGSGLSLYTQRKGAMLAALADPCILHRHLARTYNFGSGVRFGGDGFVEVLAATQTPTGEHLPVPS